tara:strand:+ start:8643 stop:9098 length:456 start_codon:yes stop_codon:yes gene_type:complete
MAWTTAKQTDGTIKYTETLASVADGEVGYSSEFAVRGVDFLNVLIDEVANSTVTLEVLKSGKTVSVSGAIGLDPSAAATDPEVWSSIVIDSGDVDDDAKDLVMLSNATKARFKVAASGGAVVQALAFYIKGTDSGADISTLISGGIGADPS